MRGTIVFSLVLLATVLANPCLSSGLDVVTTLPDYAVVTRAVAGDRVTVTAIVRGDQDAHFIRPKPSFVSMVRSADLLVDTGLDLEMWVPTVVDKSGNDAVRSGQSGYVATAQGMKLMEIPRVMSRSEGDVHIYGNPHITTNPCNMKLVARNIAAGLIKNDPEGEEYYQANLQQFENEIDTRLFGEDLVQILGGPTLCDLTRNNKLIPFLEIQEFRGKPLLDYLGGWMKEMLPLRGTALVTYHKNWVYFLALFGIEEAGTVEPKPGIPPSTKHVADLVELMKERNIRIILAANYFDAEKVRNVAARVDGVPVIVPLYVGGTPDVEDYFVLFDFWVKSVLDAAMEVGLVQS